MEPETRWGDDTVSLGGFGLEEVAAEDADVDEVSGGPKTPGESPSPGSETVVPDEAESLGAPVFPRASRREPASRRALLGAGIGTAMILFVLALTNLTGNGGDPAPQPRTSGAVRKAADRQRRAVAARIRESQRRRLERKVRAANAAKERRRLRRRRERHREMAEKKAAPTAEASPPPTPEAEAEYVPEYSPEPVPEAPPTPESAPPAADSSTPPSVEFGM
jgi:hypothetical protein